MNYKKKNGHRRKWKLHGFRHSKKHDWSQGGVFRRFVRAFMKVEEE